VLSDEENQKEEATMLLGFFNDKVIILSSSESEAQIQFPRKSSFSKLITTEQ